MTKLTTYKEWNLVAQLKAIELDLIPVCLIQIATRNKQTGLNKERGKWILELWENVTKEPGRIDGHHVDWSTIIFFTQVMEREKFQEFILNLLKLQTFSPLKSLALFSCLSGDVEKKIQEIDRMHLQIDKINYWKEHIYPIYYEDGLEVQIK